MKIGIVLSQAPAYSETFFNSKLKGLQEAGHDVVLLVDKTPVEDQQFPIASQPYVGKNGIRLVLSICQFLLYYSTHLKRAVAFWKLERAQKNRPVTILKKLYIYQHLFQSSADWLHYGFGTMALGKENIAQAIGAKMAVSFRGFDIGIFPLKNPGCYRLLYQRVDLIHVISDDIKKKVLKDADHQSSTLNIIKITPAIDVSRFKAPAHTSTLTEKQITFTTVGRLHWKKGYVHMIKALSLLKHKGIKLNYQIVGTGDDYERIAYAAVQHGLKDEVSFLGKVSHTAVKTILEKTDFYIQYSIQEGFCNAVLEAQAMGKICIVSNAEGLAENVAHQNSGFVVERNNPELLAKELFKAIGLTPQEQFEMQEKAKDRVRKLYSLEKQKDEFAKFYSK